MQDVLAMPTARCAVLCCAGLQGGRSVEDVVAEEFRAVYGEELGHVSWVGLELVAGHARQAAKHRPSSSCLLCPALKGMPA